MEREGNLHKQVGIFAMKILGIETSTSMTGVALVEEKDVIGEASSRLGLRHSQRLLPAIARVLEEAGMTPSELDGVAVSTGPGSFTGLRVGVTVAKTMASAMGKPLAGIPTLDALAFAVPPSRGLICPILDARKREVYAGLYRWQRRPGGNGRLLRKLSEDMVLPVGELLSRIKQPTVFAGSGLRLYREVIERELGELASFAPPPLGEPRAAIIGLLGIACLKAGEAIDPDILTPRYVRLPEAILNRQGKRAASGPARGGEDS